MCLRRHFVGFEALIFRCEEKLLTIERTAQCLGIKDGLVKLLHLPRTRD